MIEIYIILLLVVVVTLCFCLCRKPKNERFTKELSVFDITGVQGDACVGHYPVYEHVLRNKKMLQRCRETKFDESNDTWGELARHNKGEICLPACMMQWTDRRKALYDLLRKIANMCKVLKLEWMFYYGGLLGYHRNKELLPWDPDIDILMPVDIREKYKDSPNEIIYEDSSIIFKLRKNGGIMGVVTDKKTLLYCDVFYWVDRGDTIDISWMPMKPEDPKFLVVPRNRFFPIQYVTMNGIRIPVPSDIEHNLKTRYGNIKYIPYKLNNGKYYVNGK